MKKKYKKTIPYIMIGFCSLLILVRCFYSFTWTDESFYLSMVHRLWQGERMMVDEWYTTQLSAPLLLPFYMLYQMVVGENDGIVLYFRIIYWGISSITAFFLYIKIKKFHSEVPALICSLIYLLYSRANICGLSYYNMTLTSVLIAMVWIYEMIKGEIKKHKLILSGGFLAIAVVFTPFLAIPYMIIGICLLIKRKKRQMIVGVSWIVIGTAAVAICYLIYIFSNITIEDMLTNIPHILNEPELQRTNLFLAIPLMCGRIVWRFKWTIGVTILLLLYILRLKKRKVSINNNLIKILLVLNSIVFLFNCFFSGNLIGCINIACVLLIIPVLILLMVREEYEPSILYVFGIAGGSLSLAFSFSSDTGLDAMAIGFVPLAMGAVLLLFKVNVIVKNKVRYWMFLALLGFVLLESLILRIFSVYRDAPLIQLGTCIEAGPGKGLYTTEEHAEQYNTLYGIIKQYVREGDKVFYSKQCCWGYLCTNNEYGAPSSWRLAMNSPRLEEYYNLNPDKIPTCVIVLNPEYGKFESSIIQNNEKDDYPNENCIEGFLLDYMIANHYEVTETVCGTVYRKSIPLLQVQ